MTTANSWTPVQVGRYWKAILAFIVPGAIIVGASVLEGSDGGSTITQAEWITAIVACIVTSGSVAAVSNKET